MTAEDVNLNRIRQRKLAEERRRVEEEGKRVDNMFKGLIALLALALLIVMIEGMIGS
jgi:hypothetical protein